MTHFTGRATMWDVEVALAAGAALGALHAGWAWRARLYPRSARGRLAAVIDFTWSLPNTAAGVVFLVYALARGNEIDYEFSRHRGVLGLREGVIRGFATTVGPVQAGVALGVDEHEAVHVLQARLFGPLYLPLVAANWVLATVLPYWLLYHDRRRAPIDSVTAYFQRGVYPHCWHEEWAYRVQGTPPA
ncbi:hypothetical protein GCM10010492_67990 [Saccharothrix mutabilis subsp. mutabilis]|uniref:Uncharacterized protein n=1 Tax=Saccharothrix mutabilis subsp. mutabilis TaxID=66855 RepID=A0ABN0UPL1_9PSEU